MLKGHLTIEVFDKNGKLKQREEGDNIITNYSRDWMNVCWTNPLLRMAYPLFNPVYASDINENFKGILLFKELCTEDKNNYFNQIMTKTVVGHADSLGVSADSSQYGILNETASEITENSITRVWNFGQGKAVGTINSVALCNDNLGRKGTDDDVFINDANYKYFVDKNKNNVQQFTGGALRVGIVNNYQPEIGASNAAYTVKDIFCIKNGIIYAYDYKYDNTAKNLIINIYKCDTSKYYKKQSFNNDFNAGYNGNISFIVDNNSAFSTNTITYTTNISGLVYASAQYFNNKFYFILTTGNRAFVVIYDITTNSWSGEEKTNEKGATVRYGFAKNAQGIFVPSSDYKKIWRYTDNFVFMNEIELPEKIAGYGNIVDIHNFNDNFAILGFGPNPKKSCLTDFINYKCIEGSTYDFHTYPEFLNLICLSSNNQVNKNNVNLSTIKNLMQPVIKGETDEMKVTYKIIKTNE